MDKISVKEAVKLFDTPTEYGLYFRACNYCNERVVEGVRYSNSSEVFHEDCFQVKHAMMFPKFNPFTEKLKVTDSGDSVIISSRALNRLLDDSFSNFPSQRTYLLIGNDRCITDFIKSPLFNYQVLEDSEFSKWTMRDFGEILEEAVNIFKANKVIGFAHAHDNNGMSLSDMIYPSIHFYMLLTPLINFFGVPEKAIADFNLQLQFNSFFPIMNELVLLNHTQFKGSNPLMIPSGHERVPSKQFISYYESNHPFLRKAKKIARAKVESSIINYLSVYSLNLNEFLNHPVNFYNALMDDLGQRLAQAVLKSSDINKIKLLGYYSSKIKEHGLIIS